VAAADHGRLICNRTRRVRNQEMLGVPKEEVGAAETGIILVREWWDQELHGRDRGDNARVTAGGDTPVDHIRGNRRAGSFPLQ
jgi:hypothetical protein